MFLSVMHGDTQCALYRAIKVRVGKFNYLLRRRRRQPFFVIKAAHATRTRTVAAASVRSAAWEIDEREQAGGFIRPIAASQSEHKYVCYVRYWHLVRQRTPSRRCGFTLSRFDISIENACLKETYRYFPQRHYGSFYISKRHVVI